MQIRIKCAGWCENKVRTFVVATEPTLQARMEDEGWAYVNTWWTGWGLCRQCKNRIDRECGAKGEG